MDGLLIKLFYLKRTQDTSKHILKGASNTKTTTAQRVFYEEGGT